MAEVEQTAAGQSSPRSASQDSSQPTSPPASRARVPSVIASDVSITYRVYGSGRSVDNEEENPLRRMMQRGSQNLGVRELHAIQDVNLVAYRGESIGLVGRNGSGKSTLLRSIAGLVPPTKGRIWTNGRSSLLGVNAALIPALSGRRNVWIGAQALGLSPRQVRARFDEIVDFADIGDFIDLPMKSYSSGMAARLRFAISTAVIPDILVVDEALATGDAEFKERAEARMEEIAEKAGTIFMVSHNGKTIKTMCQRALWLEKGRIIMDGPSEEVVDTYSVTFGKRARQAARAAAAKEAAEAEAAARKQGADAAGSQDPALAEDTDPSARP